MNAVVLVPSYMHSPLNLLGLNALVLGVVAE